MLLAEKAQDHLKVCEGRKRPGWNGWRAGFSTCTILSHGGFGNPPVLNTEKPEPKEKEVWIQGKVKQVFSCLFCILFSPRGNDLRQLQSKLSSFPCVAFWICISLFLLTSKTFGETLARFVIQPLLDLLVNLSAFYAGDY